MEKQKKKGIIKRRGIYTAKKTGRWRKVEGERERSKEEVTREKNRKRGNRGWRANRAV